MGRWQRKILFSLIVYFAGFGTAIYVLAPADERAPRATNSTPSSQVSRAGFTEKDLTRCKEAVRLGIDKCRNFAEENSVRVAEFIRQQRAQHQAHGG